MADEKFGTQESEDILQLGLTVQDKIDAGLADGRWDGKDSLSLATGILADIMPAVTGANQVGNEARNYSRAEIAHLAQIVREKTSDGVGDIVEGILFIETGFLKVTGRYIANE